MSYVKKEEFLDGIFMTDRIKSWMAAPFLAFLMELMVILPIQYGRNLNGDPIIFHYGGVLMSKGYSPYLYLWDIKPPLIYHVTALFAFISPDPWTQFYLGEFTAMAMSVGTIGLVGALVYRLTQNNYAAFASGITVIGFAKFTTLPGVGVMPKLFCFFFGLAGVYAMLSRRWVIAATLATVAAGFWQFGIIFPVLVYGEALRSGVRNDLVKMAGGSAVVTLITVGPIIALGGFTAMVNQVLVTPFVMDDGAKTLAFRASKLYEYTSVLLPVLAVGILGGVYHSLRDTRYWWLTAGVCWALFQLAFLDFDGPPDVMLLVVFAALGVGIVVGSLSREAVVVTLLISFVAMNALVPMANQYQYRQHGGFEYDAHDSIEQHFVDQRAPPESCMITMPYYEHGRYDGQKAQTCSDVQLGKPALHGS